MASEVPCLPAQGTRFRGSGMRVGIRVLGVEYGLGIRALGLEGYG